MSEIMVIEGTEVERLEYAGEAVLSLPMVDRVHQKSDDTAGRAFRRNRERFIQGTDYFDLPHSEWAPLVRTDSPDQRGSSPDQKGGHRGDMVFLTLSGYLMLVKTFQDDLSWRVQRALVESYFHLKSLKQSAEVVALKDAHLALQRDHINLQQEHIALLGQKRASPEPIPQTLVDSVHRFRAEGYSIREISQEVGRATGTIHRILTQRTPTPTA